MSNEKSNKGILIIALVAVVCLAGGFFGGMQYQKSRVGGGPTDMAGGRFTPGAGGSAVPGMSANARGGAGGVSGEITAADDSSITVKTSDGSSKIVYISGSTTISKSTTGSKSDLSDGTQVMVVGSSNSDGSVAATNISVQNK